MALYINGRSVNPIVTFLISAVVLAGVVGLGILLLPVIGGLFVLALIGIGCIALYGMYCRWRYGDPFAQMQKQAESIFRRRAETREQTESSQRESDSREVRNGEARTGVRRTTTIDDAVVVEEIRRKNF